MLEHKTMMGGQCSKAGNVAYERNHTLQVVHLDNVNNGKGNGGTASLPRSYFWARRPLPARVHAMGIRCSSGDQIRKSLRDKSVADRPLRDGK